MKGIYRTYIGRLFLVVFLIISFSPLSFAGRTAQLEWRVISASHKAGKIDPRLKDIYRNLGAVFNYNSYSLINRNQVVLSPNQQVSVSLSNHETFIIKVTKITRQWVHVQIHLLERGNSIFGTTVRLMKGRTLFIGGPSEYGKALIFSLRGFW